MSLALVASVVTLAACGSSDGGTPKGTVGMVGDIPITKTELNHWMATIIGGDFYEIARVTAPKQLVSEPPNLASCVAKLKSVAKVAGTSELTHRCQQFEQLLKKQAMAYLINSDVEVGEDAERHVNVSNQEIQTSFNALRREQLPTERALQEYLTQRDWSLSDEIFLVKRNLLGNKLLQKVHQELGPKASEAQLDAYYKQLGVKWTGKTSCDPGYVVEGCKQYVAPQTPSSVSPASVIEETIR
jgi:HPt (histidine-containing phosphotransfer) domain-containing protein